METNENCAEQACAGAANCQEAKVALVVSPLPDHVRVEFGVFALDIPCSQAACLRSQLDTFICKSNSEACPESTPELI